MKIVKLDINEDSILSGIDAVALVEQPAIEEDFMYFSKEEFETYNDYPQAARDNAKKGIERNKALGNPCATQVGKVRAQQLVNGENVSLDTIRRMRSFLIRQKDNYDLAVSRNDYDACGWISYMLWGGPEALPWTEKKLRQAGEEFSIVDTKNIIVENLIKIEMGVDTSSLPNYVNELPEDIQDGILDELEVRGINEEDMLDMGYVEIDEESFNLHVFAQIIADPNKPSNADYGQIAVRYRYSGPQDSRNRTFCARLLKLNKVFRKEDLNELSLKGANEEFGIYDIFKYKGSFNCRHRWEEVFYKINTNIAKADRPLTISNRILDATTVNTKGINIPTGGKDTFAMLDEQQMVVGPLMKANKLILRKDENGDPYCVYFTPEAIKKIAYKMMKDKLIDSVNIEHDNNQKVSDAYLVESWIVEDEESDKSRKYGFEPSEGDWYGMYKIENKKIWDEYIKTGKVKGFSVEGYFQNTIQSLSSQVCQISKSNKCMCGKSSSEYCDGSHMK